MTDASLSPQGISRRGLLKIGLIGTAFLATAGVVAGLKGCSDSAPGEGFAVLRNSDMPFLHALIPAILVGAVPAERMAAAVTGTVQSMDYGLQRVSPELRKLTLQLLDVLVMPVTRAPLTGIWGSWEKASAEDMQSFLLGWRDSSVSMLKMGHSALTQMVLMAWYGRPESWGHCGYPGPPKV